MIGQARKGWDIDLRDGLAAESELVQILGAKLIEVKDDGLTRKTGNVFIEYSCAGFPSGLATTKADYWAIRVHDGTWVLVATGRLKQLAKLAIRLDRRAYGGDDNLAKGALVPVVWIVEPSKTGLPEFQKGYDEEEDNVAPE